MPVANNKSGFKNVYPSGSYFYFKVGQHRRNGFRSAGEASRAAEAYTRSLREKEKEGCEAFCPSSAERKKTRMQDEGPSPPLSTRSGSETKMKRFLKSGEGSPCLATGKRTREDLKEGRKKRKSEKTSEKTSEKRATIQETSTHEEEKKGQKDRGKEGRDPEFVPTSFLARSVLEREEEERERSAMETERRIEEGYWWQRKKSKLEGPMSLFGIRVEFLFADDYSVPPLYFDQQKRELLKSGSREEDVSSLSKKEVKEMLMDVCYKKIEGKETMLSSSLREKVSSKTAGITDLYKALSSLSTKEDWKKARKGTVVGFSPASLEHMILFDKEEDEKGSSEPGKKRRSTKDKEWDEKERNKPFVDPERVIWMCLNRSKNWRRITWKGNKLLACGEEVPILEDGFTSVIGFGPPCPKCAAPLGIGVQAWSACRMCKIQEPGSMYSLRLSKDDPYAWSSSSLSPEI